MSQRMEHGMSRKGVSRRGFLTAAGAVACSVPTRAARENAARPSLVELDRAAAAPVLRLDGLDSPVVIDSIRLLRKDKELMVHVRSKDGAEGVSFTAPGRAQYLSGILKQLVIPFFLGKDARDLKNLLWELVEKSGARAVKFCVGGRMSRNADAAPGRTETLIPLVRKTFGDAIDIHADSNSSYDPPQAVGVGRMLEEIDAVYFEEPCPFDHLEDTKKVADTLTIPVAGGEQEYSDWRFRWMMEG